MAGAEAYLDIETTGLSSYDGEITGIRIYLVKGESCQFVQLVGDDITSGNLLAALKDVATIYT